MGFKVLREDFIEVNDLIFLEVPDNTSEVMDLFMGFIHTLEPYFSIGVPDGILLEDFDVFEDGFMG